MALVNRLDAARAAARLTEWLSTRLEGATDVCVTNIDIPQSNGMAMVTARFDATSKEGEREVTRCFAARVAPSVPLIFHDSDLTREHRVLRALHGAGLKVPEPHWIEADPDVLGGEFLVMESVFG